MPRPQALDLLGDGHRWRPVPMVGANVGIEVVPLASYGREQVLLTRFPAGFRRAVAGSYEVAETFLVVSGEVDLERRSYGPRTLVHVPAGATRTHLHSRGGATALAWFSGPPVFVPGHLGPVDEVVTAVDLRAGPSGEVLRTPEAVWTVQPRAAGEHVDLRTLEWALEALPVDLAEGAQVRRLLGRQRCQA